MRAQLGSSLEPQIYYPNQIRARISSEDNIFECKPCIELALVIRTSYIGVNMDASLSTVTKDPTLVLRTITLFSNFIFKGIRCKLSCI